MSKLKIAYRSIYQRNHGKLGYVKITCESFRYSVNKNLIQQAWHGGGVRWQQLTSSMRSFMFVILLLLNFIRNLVFICNIISLL